MSAIPTPAENGPLRPTSQYSVDELRRTVQVERLAITRRLSVLKGEVRERVGEIWILEDRLHYLTESEDLAEPQPAPTRFEGDLA